VTRARLVANGRAWLGPAAAALAITAAAWLVSEYIYARYVTPIETARVEDLKAQAKTDTEVQKVLVPEWDRQHASLVRRRAAYRIGGLALVAAIGVFFAWMRWLRPADGQWAGVPPALARVLSKARDRPAPAALQPRAAGASAAVAAPRPPGIDLSPLLSRRAAAERGVDPGAIDAILQAAGTRRDSIRDDFCRVAGCFPVFVKGSKVTARCYLSGLRI